MAVSLLHRYNSTAGTVPTATALKVREIGVNTADGILYVQTQAGAIKAINPALGLAPQSLTFDMGSIPINAASFTATVQGVTTAMNVKPNLSGYNANGAYPDEFEMEPMQVYASVLSANTVMFTLTCCESQMMTVGKKTVTFYAG